MHILRNETKNQVIRDTLNQLTCHLETDDEDEIPAASLFSTKPEAVNTLFEDEDPSLNPLNTESLDSDDDEYYDDNDYQQQESLQNPRMLPEVADPTLRRLFRIPLADLPCVEESKPPTQTQMPIIKTPAYAEINSNRCSNNPYSITLFICAIAILIYST